MTLKAGQKTFNFGLRIPADKAADAEAAIRSHAVWMRDTHSYDSSKIQLVHYYVSKSDELNNPMAPDEGTTGNVLFTINEVYVEPEGIGRHMEAAQNWAGFPGFFEVLSTYGDIVVINGDVIEAL